MIMYAKNAHQHQSTRQKLTIDEMAATMQDMDAVGEAVTQENLKLRGYTTSDISLFGLLAANLARQRAIKLVTA